MFRLSTCLFIWFNFLALICGCFFIGSYLYFQIYDVTDCQNVVQNPLMVLGIVLIAISLLGLIGIFCKITCLLWLYSFVALLFLIGLAVFALYVYMADNPSEAIRFKKHRVRDFYSQWFQNMVSNGKQWKSIRDCLINHQVCKRLNNKNFIRKPSDFYLKKLSPIESGCSKPPIYCGYEYKNATFWILPKSSEAPKESDCKSWSNKKDKLCFNCNSCKNGVIEKSKAIWRIFAIIDFIDIAIILIMFALSCSTRNYILADRKYHRGYA